MGLTRTGPSVISMAQGIVTTLALTSRRALGGALGGISRQAELTAFLVSLSFNACIYCLYYFQVAGAGKME